jgi:hypothetical protein
VCVITLLRHLVSQKGLYFLPPQSRMTAKPSCFAERFIFLATTKSNDCKEDMSVCLVVQYQPVAGI